MSHDEYTSPIERLFALIETLWNPDYGCAWDVAQTASSIVPFTIEEAYEVADAVANGRSDELCEELGDLLFQVVFQAQIAREAGDFDFHDVATGIVSKMIRRHPHVFDEAGNCLDVAERICDPDAIATIWRQVKERERGTKQDSDVPVSSPLSGIAKALPALARAEKLSMRAASFGFDWSDPVQVLGKVREEIGEVEAAMVDDDRNAVREEIGDLLFSVANLARHLAIDPEDALRSGNEKFKRRFDAMVALLGQDGNGLGAADLDTMEAAWRRVKDTESKA